MTSIAILIVFSLFFVKSARALARRDGVFCAFYVILFVYTFFTQVVYLAYPDDFVGLVPGDAPITDSTFLAYQGFVFASFVGVFFVLWWGTNARVALRTYQAPNNPWRFQFFIFLVLLYDAVLVFILFYNYETLSYETPDALKSQTLFARFFVLFPVVFLALYATGVHVKADAFKRGVCQFLAVLTASIFLVIAVRAGTRTAMATTMIGVLCFEALRSGAARRLFSPVMVISAVSIFVVLTAIATYRTEGPTNLVDLPVRVAQDRETFISTRLSLRDIVRGDYAGPSVMLMSSMSDEIVIPSTGLAAIFFGCLPFGAFSGYQSIGYIVSRIVDPSLQDAWKGFGYYILAEGYNVMGWFGILYNAVVIGFGLRVSRRFWNTPDRFYRAFVGALFAIQGILIVRGQSSEIIRAWYLVILPGVVFLWLGCGLRADWSRRSNAVAASQSGARSRFPAAARANWLVTPRRAVAEPRISAERASCVRQSYGR